MQSRMQMPRALFVVLGLACFITWSAPATAAEHDDQSCAEESLMQVAAADSGMSSTGETAPPSGDVQERAVPRMVPGGIVPGMPGQVEGAILEKGRVRVQPGYVLQQQADGTVMARKAGGGGGGGTFSCFCALGRGGCKMIVQGGEAWCKKSDSNPCSGSCDMKISKFSMGPAVIQ